MAFDLLKVATDTEQFDNLRSWLRPGRFWKISARNGTLAGAYLLGIAPSVNVLRASINAAFLAMLPGMSDDTLAMWEKLCGTRVAAQGLTIDLRKGLLSFWLFGVHGPTLESIDGLVTALGGTITWAPEYQSGEESWGMPFCVGLGSSASEFGVRCTVGLPSSDEFGSLEPDWAVFVKRAKLEGLTNDTFAAFLVLEPILRPAHLRITYDLM